jgi:hypothetical protein
MAMLSIDDVDALIFSFIANPSLNVCWYVLDQEVYKENLTNQLS